MQVYGQDHVLERPLRIYQSTLMFCFSIPDATNACLSIFKTIFCLCDRLLFSFLKFIFRYMYIYIDSRVYTTNKNKKKKHKENNRLWLIQKVFYHRPLYAGQCKCTLYISRYNIYPLLYMHFTLNILYLAYI